jgi:kynurenine formamidase
VTVIAPFERVVDLSPPIETNMPRWPPHPDVAVINDARNYRQNGYFAQSLVLSEHSASHVDAPAHMHEALADRTIDTYPVEKFMGPAKLIDLSPLALGPGECATEQQLRAALGAGTLRPGDFALIRFDWSPYEQPEGERHRWERNSPGLAEDACRFLAEQEVAGVASDTLGCDAAMERGRVTSAHGHMTYFLPRDILIYEGLVNLADVSPESFFIALPLRVTGGSGAPFRGVALCPAKESQ